MSDRTFPEWQREYLDALLELDPVKLPERITDAETTLLVRMHALVTGLDRDGERQAIEDALDALYLLKRDKLGFPDWRLRPVRENEFPA